MNFSFINSAGQYQLEAKNTFAASEIKSRTLTGIKSNSGRKLKLDGRRLISTSVMRYNEMVDEIFQSIVIAGRVCDSTDMSRSRNNIKQSEG